MIGAMGVAWAQAQAFTDAQKDKWLPAFVKIASIGTLAGGALCRALSDKFPWGLVVNPYGLAAAWGIALLLAVTFGLYPAIRAARLSPMAAMR